MHGLPLAWAKFERKNVAGVGWRVAISGQNEIVQGTYSEGSGRAQLAFAEPGFYLVVVQTETGRAETEIELETQTALAINTLGRWKVGGIVQPIQVVPAANGLADPFVQNLTRQWMPFERVSMAWVVETTNKNQAVRWRWTSGQTQGQHTGTVYAWRLFNYAGGIQKNQDADRLFVPLQTSTPNITATPTETTPNVWYNPVFRQWYLVECNAAGQIFWEPDCFYDYAHELVVNVKIAEGNAGFKGFKLYVDSQQTQQIIEIGVNYSLDNTYTATFPRRAPGHAITRVWASVGNGSKFYIWAKLNVTD